MNGLQYILKRDNIQQRELAEKVGVSKQIVNIWVTGRRRVPKKYLPQISNILNIPTNFINSNINQEELNQICDSFLNNDYKNILSLMFDVKREFIDDDLIKLIELTLKKRVIEKELNDIKY
ncbi:MULTISPECIES: helix-turn-helix domain-containing protein [unclassified Clostridium]|uniref:helix-turn-helix domain-containing protein n=1 Tax=unclassified Clostridium TaxID=2614128 RepID=UPI00207A3A81|nr:MULTISPECIES: helix-turn-helix domain-containing protein [unclassified Clostridium]